MTEKHIHLSTLGRLRGTLLVLKPHLTLNVSGCFLGVFELLHQRNIPQKITMSCREPIQQVVLQPLELNLEVVLLRGQRHLQKHAQNSSGFCTKHCGLISCMLNHEYVIVYSFYISIRIHL